MRRITLYIQMKKKVLTFSRIFSAIAGVPMLSLGLIACTQDKIEEYTIPCAQEGHVHAVDLGLSVKWACCNVGATSPEEFGGYYAWGDPVEKDSCIWTKYEWYNDSIEEIIKYNDLDGKTALEATDDVAQTLWGDEWRMPTQAEMKELMDRCTWTWTSVNGVYGYRVSGNGNSIFLPAAGSQYEDLYTSQGSQGCYMSSTLYGDDYELEICLGFNKKDRYTINSDRCDGHTIRPVKK